MKAAFIFGFLLSAPFAQAGCDGEDTFSHYCNCGTRITINGCSVAEAHDKAAIDRDCRGQPISCGAYTKEQRENASGWGE